MLLFLLLIAWLAAIVLALALCRMAARGDAAAAHDLRQPPPLNRRWAVRPGRPLRGGALRGAARRRAHLTAHGARRHRAPSAAGS